MSRFFYSNTINDFIEDSLESVIGKMTLANGGFQLEPTQRDAWSSQISILKEVLNRYLGTIFLEYAIP